jgi:hypothetical protein
MLIQCSDKTHRSCSTIKNKIKELDPVYDAYKTRFVEDGKLYCIGAKAKVPRNELSQLEDTIWGLHDKRHDITVKLLKAYHE